MMTIESLKAAGANVEEGLSRCLNKEDFYLKMVNMGLTNQNFQLLGPADRKSTRLNSSHQR